MQPIDWQGNLLHLYFDLAGNPTIEVLRSLLSITASSYILYSSDCPYLPDDALKVNLQKLKQTIASDKELGKYANLIFGKNAESLFVKSEVSDSIPTE